MKRKTLIALIIAIPLGSGCAARPQVAELHKSTPLSSAKWAWAHGVSADGSVIVGFVNKATNAQNCNHGRETGGCQGCVSGFGGASANDGNVVHAYVVHAYRWTQSGGAQDLGTMGGKSADASGVSADGSVIVGTFTDANCVAHAYRWTQSGNAQDLGTMGGKSARASGISADGSVIVGDVDDGAYRWTQSGGAQHLLINSVPLPATGADAVDACSLLTQGEMSAAVGIPMYSGRHDFPGTAQECSWHRRFPPPGGPPPIILSLQLFVEPAEGFEWNKHNVSQENVTSVSGLGEDAYYTEQGEGSAMTLNVKKGDLCVIVTWILVTDRQTVMDAEKTIAAQVLSKL